MALRTVTSVLWRVASKAEPLRMVISGRCRVASELCSLATNHSALTTAFKSLSTRHFLYALVPALLSPLFTGHSSLIQAQSESASLSGTIVDRRGGLVPDAQVSIVNTDTNVTFDTKTNNAGVYAAPFLKPGHYRILVKKEGFKQSLVFRAESFNIFNHPNAGNIDPCLCDSTFGQSNPRHGGVSTIGASAQLYGTGAPRSFQLMLKLQF
jgi:hypothetical protein